MVIASMLGVQACVATQNTAAIGWREERGVVASANDMSVAGTDLIFHGNLVEIRALGGTTFSGESKPYRIAGIARGRGWWATVDREEFGRSAWSARSLRLHRGALPSAILDRLVAESQRPGGPSTVPAGDRCYSLVIMGHGLMELTTCEGKPIGMLTENRVTLRSYREWWAYPSIIVAYPMAIAFDTVSFPLQLYAYVQWNGERTRW